MVDFLLITTRVPKRGIIEIYPKFVIKKSTDLMIRGSDFYAIWLEEANMWSTEEQDVLKTIDRELDIYAKENQSKFGDNIVKILYMWDSENGMIDKWHKYCQKHMRDCFHPLDEKLIFSNTEVTKKDYTSKRLNYPLEEGTTEAYDTLMSTLYSEEERHKIEWAIGSIISGDSKTIQKFIVLYGGAGTGKSTILNIIQQLFEGYYSVFDARALGSSSNSFALEAFKSNPLVAIQHDGDLSKIEDNTRLNSLVSHEMMTVNEKFKTTYANRFKCFLFMGTNKPVRITDGRSGLIRRLIDVAPSGNKLPIKQYRKVTGQIDFELGAIAHRCLNVYLDNIHFYDDYIPIAMLGASNDFYNFVIDAYHVFSQEDGTTLKAAWEMYKTYCDEAKVLYPFSQRVFKEELRSYFSDYKDRYYAEDGTRLRSYFSGFKTDKFETPNQDIKEVENKIKFKGGKSIFDKQCEDCKAQYASKSGKPTKKWDNVTTKLSDLDTSKLHYVMLPKNHIVIDFDIPDENGEKSLEKNLEAASRWPRTYAEFSKSGKGIHLHYIYNGDVDRLSRVYDDHIEVKVPIGNSSLRRLHTKNNHIPISTISSGLPLKGEDKVINLNIVESERGLRTKIKRNLKKEYHPGTKPSIDFIFKILDDAYKSGLKYDVSDMRAAIFNFAANSTNQADYCMKLVNKMQFKSDEVSDILEYDNDKLVFYDVEVFPNLFVVCWKLEGEDNKVIQMINPTPTEIEKLIRYKLVGFNCRRYDNHILYARLMGYTNQQLYSLSQKIILNTRNAFFGEAYNISYTDIYDFSTIKQSLKKFMISLGIHHQELGLPWDAPVDESLWQKVADYCSNDVMATEATFKDRHGDFVARQILADLAGMTVNNTTNTLTTRIIFGENREPQEEFNYRDMGDISKAVEHTPEGMDPEYTKFDKSGNPIFPGYKYDAGISTYRGEVVGEGGYVYAEPGMYDNITLLDIASMHPSSIVNENLFGDEYTKRFKELLDARLAIKAGDYKKAKKMFDGALESYLTDDSSAKDLSYAFKIAINSVYGLTSARFMNTFRDPRNIDNIVAKRGALFMINLKHEVQNRGYQVAHIKTDSIKVQDADKEILDFIFEYGKLYGYNFELEAEYDRFCLLNDAVYICRDRESKRWSPTGTQTSVPYVFKKLFSKEEIEFKDLCEAKAVQTAIYLDLNEGLEDVSEIEKDIRKWVKIARELSEETIPTLVDVRHTIEEPTLKEAVDQYILLSEEAEKGHNYRFIGKTGLFTPVVDGAGGGILYRYSIDKDGLDKYSAVSGTKGHRWIESELFLTKDKKDVDYSYFNALVDELVQDISMLGDFEWFVSE